MGQSSHRWWIGVTAMLTVVLLIIVFPILQAKYGLATAILLSMILVFGMILYYLRGMLISGSKSRKPRSSENETKPVDSGGR
jgi:hypothetical protein